MLYTYFYSPDWPVTPTFAPVGEQSYTTGFFKPNAAGEAAFEAHMKVATHVIAYAIPPGCTSATFTVTPVVRNWVNWAEAPVTSKATVSNVGGSALGADSVSLAGGSEPLVVTVPVAPAASVVRVDIDTTVPFPTWVEYTAAAAGTCSAVPASDQVKIDILAVTPGKTSTKVSARVTSAFTDGVVRPVPQYTQVRFADTWVGTDKDGMVDVVVASVRWESTLWYAGTTSSKIKCTGAGKKCSW